MSDPTATAATVEVERPACRECDGLMVPVTVRDTNVLSESYVREIRWICLACEAEEAEAFSDYGGTHGFGY